MGMGDKRATKLIALAQEQVPHEQVLGAAILSPKGKTGSAMAFGAIGAMVHSASQTAAAGFAAYNLIAFTDTGLHAWAAGVNMGTKIKAPIGSWPWGSFGASTKPGAMTQALVIGWPNGELTALEAQTNTFAKFQAAVIIEIARRASMAGMPPPPI